MFISFTHFKKPPFTIALSAALCGRPVMTTEDSLRALLDSQQREISALQDEITSLRQSEADLKSRVLRLSQSAKSSDEAALAPFLARIAEIKSEQKAVAESQAELLKSLQNEFQEFRKSILTELAGVLRAASARFKAAPARGQPVAAALEEAAAEKVLIAEGRNIIRASPENPLDGLLAALGRQVGGNPVTKGEIVATASGSLDESRLGPHNAAEPQADTNFVSQNSPQSWLQYDFKNRKVQVSAYSIRSRFDGFTGSNNLKDWSVRVSGDGKVWTEIDSQTDNEKLNGKNAVAVFQVKGEVGLARFVRLQQTGPAHSGKNFLALSGFELFGVLTD
jgi:hypothetical protein